MRLISGTMKSTPTASLPALCDILPPDLRRKNALLKEYQKILTSTSLPVNHDVTNPPRTRLKSRCAPTSLAQQLSGENFCPNTAWEQQWSESGLSFPLFASETRSEAQFHLQRKAWCNLNRLRTGHSRCYDMMVKWQLREDPSCECGADKQTMKYIWLECHILRFNGTTDDLIQLGPTAVD